MKNNKIIYQVDAFTSEPFKGNPAGVMIVNEQVTEDWMQNVAMEMNLSETAFIIPGEEKFEIRYFTPTQEVPLCGHATLASAHIIYELGIMPPDKNIVFQAKAGNLIITKDEGFIVMQFPEYPINRLDNIPENFKEVIGFEPIEFYSSIDDWIIAIASTEDEILNAKPNFERMVNEKLGHLMITTAQSRKFNSDFVVRCFAPSAGINEDPVTGSAHCALTPLWAKKLNKTQLKSLQLSKRTGKLDVCLKNNKVEIKGQAVTIFKAELFVYKI